MMVRHSLGLVAVMAMACTFSSGGTGSGGGLDSASDTESSGATSSGEATSTSQGSATGTGTSQGLTSEGPTSEGPTSEGPTSDATTTDPDTGETSDSTTDGTSSDTGQPADLVDDGLIARYFLDEAGDGMGPRAALDSSGNELDMPITYNAAVVRYTMVGGHRGLEWTAAGAVGGPSRPTGGPVNAALDGAQQATLEVVVDVQDVVDTGSRFIHIGVGSNSDLSLLSANVNQVELRTFGEVGVGRWPLNLPQTGRVLLTLVIDTTEALALDRARLYVDGARVAAANSINITQDELMSIEAGAQFFLGNRGDANDRSFEGVLYYAALYGAALSEQDVKSNADRLSENDDS